MFKHRSFSLILALIVTLSLVVGPVAAQGNSPDLPAAAIGSAFTYQGQLKDSGGNPVNATCAFKFSLYNDPTAGSQVGTTQNPTGILVTNGLFSVPLDFGSSAFAGQARWLAIEVKCGSDANYTTLSPRQALTPTPYALYSVTAGTAANLSGVLPVAHGGTGSSTQNFVDLSTDQSVAGVKTFTGAPSFTASTVPFAVTATGKVTNLNADLLDGYNAGAFQKQYSHLLVVAKSGGNYSTLTAALNSITNNSATNTYLIYVAPGIYSEQVTMKPFVDIEGAGEGNTKITWTGSSSSTTGTVVGSDNAELRFLTVENTGGNTDAFAIYNSGTSPRLTQVTAKASGGSENYGMYNTGSSNPTMTNVSASASGGSESIGVFNFSSSPTMMNVNASGKDGSGYDYGVLNSSNSLAVMTNVVASASGGPYCYGVYNNSSSPTMTGVMATASGGTYAYGVYNQSSSPTIMNSSASASGATYTDGVFNQSSSPVMMNVSASASGGQNTKGVENTSSSNATMMSVNASASGGTNNYGVLNQASSPMMTNVTAYASGGDYTTGVYNYNGSLTMTNITITAKNASNGNTAIYNNAANLTIMGGSLLCSGGSGCTGLDNEPGSTATLSNVNISAWMGTNATYGIYNLNGASIRMESSYIYSIAYGSGIGYGIIAFDLSSTNTGNVWVDGSQILANTYSISADSFYHVYVGASMLGNSIVGSGTFKCVDSYNNSYNALNSTCH